MKTKDTYTKEKFLKDLNQLKESNDCPVSDTKFYEPWDMVRVNRVYKREVNKN